MSSPSTKSDQTNLQECPPGSGLVKVVLSELNVQRKLAIPLIAMNLAWFAKTAVTTAFLGHLGELNLAGAALGFTFANVTGFSVMNGLSGAMEPICGQAYGARNFKLLHKTLLELAAEGFIVRSALHDWYATFQKWSADNGTPTHNPQSILATIYFHSISIYLSGIFDYRAQFNKLPTPTISQDVVQNHVDEILRITEISLKTSNLAAVLFFFPLRVAGARVTTARETESICAMLGEISMRGFVVADAFTVDLKSVWHQKGM